MEVADGTRPLPTGTIVGPDGKQYALYSEVPYELPNGEPNPEYATADTTVVDLADPSKSIGALPGISQASGVYDPNTNRMIVVGNTGPHPGDRARVRSVADQHVGTDTGEPGPSIQPQDLSNTDHCPALTGATDMGITHSAAGGWAATLLTLTAVLAPTASATPPGFPNLGAYVEAPASTDFSRPDRWANGSAFFRTPDGLNCMAGPMFRCSGALPGLGPEFATCR